MCPLFDIGFDMNLGKISAKISGRENGKSRPLPCQRTALRRVKRVMRFYVARINFGGALAVGTEIKNS
jgi:hypothetical protein